MPIYEYYCDCYDGEEVWESFHKVDDRNNEKCPDCGQKASIAMSVGQRPVIMEYYSENLQANVTGPAHRKQLMKQKGLEERG